MSDFTLSEFTLEATLAAFGTLSKCLGNTEDWDHLALFPKTLVALRQMPPEHQTEIAAPYIKGCFDAIEPTCSDIFLLGEYDEVIASGVSDLFQMTMEMAQQQAMQRQQAHAALSQGKGVLLR